MLKPNVLNRYKQFTLQTMQTWAYSGAELANLVAAGLPHDSAFGALILGEPGSGKTCIALQMAVRLVELGWPTPAVFDDPHYARFRENKGFSAQCGQLISNECRARDIPFIMVRDVSHSAVRHPVVEAHPRFSPDMYFVDFVWIVRQPTRGTVKIDQLKDRYRRNLIPSFTTRLKPLTAMAMLDNCFVSKATSILRHLR